MYNRVQIVQLPVPASSSSFTEATKGRWSTGLLSSSSLAEVSSSSF